MTSQEFQTAFETLTGHPPFPWQTALYERFIANRTDNIPAVASIPTGLGKTNVIAVWLLAWLKLREQPSRPFPRRLVYVVNRRTVVDQTTNEVERLREKLPDVAGEGLTLGISTLRGQYADNREWSADPSQPAVICGTVDMIGSRLLFSGYRIGFRSRPLHAGFLGQDVLLVHDEAHLEPAFQCLIKRLEREQAAHETSANLPWSKLQVMAMSATARNEDDKHELSDDDLSNGIVKQRLHAVKRLELVANDDDKKLADQMADLALETYRDTNDAVLIFARKVEDVEKIAATLRKQKPKLAVATLTGTMRGFERERLVESELFGRFLPGAEQGENAAFLICTSAGEVGVNISADHLVCDLSTYDSMAQRFGRVNRFGERNDTEIHVLFPIALEKAAELDDLQQRQKNTLELLRKLNGDASPAALNALNAADREAAFAPQPRTLKTSDILFDAWAMTSLPGSLPGRPPVEPYLHGISEFDPPQTQVAWREEVAVVNEDLRDRYPPEELLARYPLKPHELLSDRSDRVFKHLAKLAERTPDEPVWLVDEQGLVKPMPLKELADSKKKSRLDNRIVILSPETGGLDEGHLSGKAAHDPQAKRPYDVADLWGAIDDEPGKLRVRLRGDDDEFADKTKGMRCVLTIDTRSAAEEESGLDDEGGADTRHKIWHWYVRPLASDDDLSRKTAKPVELQVHVDDVVRELDAITEQLSLPPELQAALLLAARFHDLGKRPKLFQRILGNFDESILLAKSGGRSPAREINRHYRHELRSLCDVLDGEQEFLAELSSHSAEMQDVVLHLIAAHHGRGRPHFSREESTASADGAKDVAAEVPLRYARLQHRYGRWGLAYLESLLRAADWAASAGPSEYYDAAKEVNA